jgi:hypothetical protein
VSARQAVVIAAATCFVAALTSAATIQMLDVTKKRGRYELVVHTHMDAPAQAIFDVLVDYDRLYRISRVYKETRYLEPAADGTPLVFTRMAGCMMFYCMDMARVERLEAEAPHFIRTETLPEQSDFKYARSEWILEPATDGTQVSYTLELEPDFFVPPVIGPWVLKRTLLRGGGRVIARIERLANGLPARLPGDD